MEHTEQIEDPLNVAKFVVLVPEKDFVSGNK